MSLVASVNSLRLCQSQVYEKFRGHLSGLGFTLYPGEFDCLNSDHPLVDIAARMGAYYWAFEYKSEHDSISRGVEQVCCYSDWFDYVVLVSERTLDHRRSDNYWKLRRMGAGIWVYDPEKDERVVKAQPVIRNPDLISRRLVSRRFSALGRTRSCKSHSVAKDNLQCDMRVFLST
ncbi:MAG: hypothetical protein ACREBQ_04430 [Nitrososphaerales archaeon]